MAVSRTKVVKPSLFTWKGYNRRRELVHGEMTEESIAIAKAKLRQQGITGVKIVKKRKSLFKRGSKKVKPIDVAVFLRQMATMLSAGIPLLQALELVGRSLNHPGMLKVIAMIKADIEGGNTLKEALDKHSLYFSDLVRNLVEAGEQSGTLDQMLDRIATYREKIETLKGKIKKSLFYPAAVVVVAIVVTAALLIFVIPQFESLFKGFGADLPVLTKTVIAMSAWLQAYWWIIAILLGIVVWSFIKALKTKPGFAHFIDRIALRTPIIGKILYKAAIARFCRTLGITFAAGLPLVDALVSVAGATGNILFSKATMRIREEVSAGQTIASALHNTGMFPPMVEQMISIGEESGSLEDMLSKAADIYEEQVDNAVDSLSSLLEPLIMALLGGLVGTLVISMYLPIFQLGSVV